jgi:SAM-dependent methyltransferase
LNVDDAIVHESLGSPRSQILLHAPAVLASGIAPSPRQISGSAQTILSSVNNLDRFHQGTNRSRRSQRQYQVQTFHMDVDRTTAYFNRQAAGYQTASTRGAWSWLRSSESRAVLALVGPVDGAAILELGCGAGFYTRALLARGAAHVWAIDRAAQMLRALPAERVTPVLGDAATVTLGRAFSLIVAAGIFEFAAPGAVLANAAAHASPHARLVVLYSASTLAGRALRAFHAGHGVDVRLYTRSEFDAAALASGWRIEESRACGLFGIAARYSRRAA